MLREAGQGGGLPRPGVAEACGEGTELGMFLGRGHGLLLCVWLAASMSTTCKPMHVFASACLVYSMHCVALGL